MAKERYITIQEFMVKDLKLKGNELFVYAIIYGFCQDNDSSYYGGTKYIAEWLQISQRTVMSMIQNLINKNLIKQIKAPDNSCIYDIPYEKLSQGVMKNFHKGYEKLSQAPYEKLSQAPYEKVSLPTLNEINIRYLIDNNKIYKQHLIQELKPSVLKEYVNYLLQDNNLTEIMLDYLRGRYKAKIKTTINALTLLCKKIMKMPLEVRQEAIENSIMNGWQGIFEPKTKKSQELKDKAREIYIQEHQDNSKAIKIDRAFKQAQELKERWNNNRLGVKNDG